jgi:hypothetical protein
MRGGRAREAARHELTLPDLSSVKMTVILDRYSFQDPPLHSVAHINSGGSCLVRILLLVELVLYPRQIARRLDVLQPVALLIPQGIDVDSVECAYLPKYISPHLSRDTMERRQTHTDTVPVKLRLRRLAEVDAKTGAALGAEQLVLQLGVEAVDGAALERVAVPCYVLTVGICEWVNSGRSCALNPLASCRLW